MMRMSQGVQAKPKPMRAKPPMKAMAMAVCRARPTFFSSRAPKYCATMTEQPAARSTKKQTISVVICEQGPPTAASAALPT